MSATRMHPDYKSFCENAFTRRFQAEILRGIQVNLSELLLTNDHASSERAKGQILALQYVVDLPDKIHAEMLHAETTAGED